MDILMLFNDLGVRSRHMHTQQSCCYGLVSMWLSRHQYCSVEGERLLLIHLVIFFQSFDVGTPTCMCALRGQCSFVIWLYHIQIDILKWLTVHAALTHLDRVSVVRLLLQVSEPVPTCCNTVANSWPRPRSEWTLRFNVITYLI